MAFVSTGHLRFARICFAPAGNVSALLSAIAPQDPRRGSPFLRYAGPAMLAVFCSGLSWASYSLTFQGYAQTLNTGSGITLNSPAGIVVDPAGNIYVADTGNGRIVEVTVQGTASVLTISGLSPALVSPAGITIDGAGNLYVTDADPPNSRLVQISSSGAASVISTAGVTLSSPKGVALDQSGDIFIADTGNNRIVEVASGGSAAALSITVSSGSSTLNTPLGLTVDVSGALYIADSANNRVVKVAAGSTTGVAISTGQLNPALSSPSGVAVDCFGNIFIADTGNNRIVDVDTAGTGSVLLNSSYLQSVTLSGPLGLALDVFGTAYIADTGNGRAVIVNGWLDGDPGTGAAYTSSLNKSVVGFGHVQLGASSGVTLTLPFTIGYGQTLGTMAVKALTSGTPNLDFTLGPNTDCNNTTGGGFGGSCNVEITFLPTAPGLRTGAVVLYDTNEAPILTLPLYGWGDSPVAALSPNTASVISTGGVATNYPYQLALDGAGNMYLGNYVQDGTSPKVVKVPAGGGTGSLISTSPVTLGISITGIAVDGAGNVFIADYYNNRIVVVTPGGVASVLSISGLSPALGEPTELAFDGAGNLYIADYAANGRAYSRVVEVSALIVSGSTSTGLGRVISTGSYTFPSSSMTGLAVAPNGTVYIAARTSNSGHVVQVTAAGSASLLSPNGVTFSNPQGAFVDGMGNLYVEDSGNARFVRITTAGVASALSVSGLLSPSSLAPGYGVTVDALGNLYIPDWNNSRIVFVNVSASPLTFAGTKVGLTSTDSPKTATVTNIGDQALVLAADPAYTADFSQSSSGTNQCFNATSLSSGTACNVSVQFTPQSVGALSASITVTDNTLNVSSSTQQISVNGTGINPGDTTAAAVTTSPAASASIGQPLTITATVTDTATGHTSTVPTGSVSFTDTIGSTVVSLNSGTPVALSGGIATLTGVTLSGAGTHTIAANYIGVSGIFLASSNTTSIAVTKTQVTVAGPASQPVQVINGQPGSVAITVTGPYSGFAVPAGSLTYALLDSNNATVDSGTLTLTAGSADSGATIPLAATLASGNYAINVNYNGDANYAATTATAIQVSVGQITPVISWAQPAPITYGTRLTALLNASAANGSTPVPGSFAYTATAAGGVPLIIGGTSVLGAGSYTLTATFTPTDTTSYVSASDSVALTVTKAAPAIVLSSSADTVLVTNSVTFTATVSSSASTPAGSVNFYVGTTLLGSATLSQGIAAYSTSSLAIGSHSLTAVYSGNTNFSAITSSGFTLTVDDFSLTVSAGSPTSAIAAPGSVATFALTVGPSNGTTFPAPVSLSVRGLPPGATAVITPQTLPAGAGLTNVALAINLPSVIASLHGRSRMGGNASLILSLVGAFLPGMILLPLRRKIRKGGGKRGRILCLLLLALLGASLAGLTGCAKNSGFFGHQEQTYTLTFTATSGTLSHSTTLSLTVQ
jgi:sugar lactone lactonase YvrE